jgi:aryl-alcohol dehydrogenase-like predicted oxidoreductase
MLPGRATAEGSARYRDRFSNLRDAGHFRDRDGLQLSSIGLGTYLGEPDDEADTEYIEAVTCALRSGVNLLDTAINYRHQRSERNIGAALKDLVRSEDLRREEVFVCTKAGYLSFDGNMPADPSGYFVTEYVNPGILDPKQIAGGMHCMAPVYLENQIDRSRHNLGLETIDLFYIHNPESQLADVSREVFRQRLRDAFAMLERRVKSGAVQFYGLATWGAFRVGEGSRDYISLPETVELAREIGGEHHHFRFIQVPFNLAMPEAFALNNQAVGKTKMSVLAAASQLGIRVIGSAALYQGQLTHGLPDAVTRILGLKTAAENAIQFARSAPGMTASLVGMGHKEHVTANLKAALVPPCPETEWMKLFSQR